jgi:hypothetical protein
MFNTTSLALECAKSASSLSGLTDDEKATFVVDRQRATSTPASPQSDSMDWDIDGMSSSF